MNKYKILILLFLLKGGVSNGEEDKKSTEVEKTQQTEVLEDGTDVNTIDFTEFKDFLIQEGEPEATEATEEELLKQYQMLTENQKRLIQTIQGVVLTFTDFKDFSSREEGPKATEEELQEKYSTLTKGEKFIILSMKQLEDELRAIAHLENENPALFEEKENEIQEKHKVYLTFMEEVGTTVASSLGI